MTWLFVPGVSCPSAPASEDSTSACDLPSQRLAASATWRGKPRQPASWSCAWKTGGSIRRLSGLTLPPSTLEHGAAQWIASCREIPASRTVLPANDREVRTIGGCLTRRSTSLPPAGRVVSSGRTCRGTRTDSLKCSSHHWKHWAAALRAEYSARAASEPASVASGSSSWPTATVMDAHGARNRTSGRSDPNSQHHDGVTLLDAILIHLGPMWETPTVAVTNGTRRNRGGDRSAELLLTGQAAEVSHRYSHPAPIGHNGGPSSLHGRTLNPLFVEWLMGLPIGWTASEPVETASSHWWQAMRGELSRLVSRQPAQPMLL